MYAYKLMVSLSILSASASVSAVDLSPGKWPAQERARLEQMEQSPWPSTTRVVEGRSEFIAATLSPIATHVGMQTLRSGGEKPLSTKFGQSTVFGPGEHGAAGWTTLGMLNLLDALRITELGPYWEDSRAFAAYARTLQFATVGHYSPKVTTFEREHGFASTPAERLTPRYAQTIAPAIAELSGYGKPAAEGHHSAAVVAVDRWGNVAALVHSINSSILGDTGIVVQGIPLSGAGGIYQYMGTQCWRSLAKWVSKLRRSRQIV